VDDARFAAGLTYRQFVEGMTRNRERLEANESAVVLDPRDVAYFRSLRPLRIVALVEDWCGDVIANLPVVAALAREVGPAIELRCFIKGEHPDLAARFLNRGRFESIPVFVVYDADWREVGVIIERPVAVTERREEDRHAIHAEHPEFGAPDAPVTALDDDTRTRLQAEIQARRAAWKPWADRQLVLSLRDTIARAPQPGERVAHP
jgi:hypothetical protein